MPRSLVGEKVESGIHQNRLRKMPRKFSNLVYDLRRKNYSKFLNKTHIPLPSFEKLVGYLSGACPRRINIQHRLVYQILEDVQTVKVIRMWTHYE